MGFPEEMTFMLPFGNETMKLPDPDLMLMYKDMEDRHFWLDTIVTLDDCSLLLRYIQYLNRKDSLNKQPITLHIASPGGDIDVMFALYNTLINSKIPVHTINEGGAHSAAFIIFLAGEKRTMNPNATFIAHEGSGAMRGSFRENKMAMRQHEKDVERMKEIIVERTDFTLEELSEQFEREQDFYINYEMAKEKGVITE